MSQVPRLCRWLLSAVAPVVPPHLRDEWKREWYGELWHWIDARAGAGDREAHRIALSHCAGAVADAIQLRRSDEPTRASIRRVTAHPATPVAVVAAVLMGLAFASSWFTNVRRMVNPLPYQTPEELVVLRQLKNPHLDVRLGLPLIKIGNWKSAKTLQGVSAFTRYDAAVETAGRFEVTAMAVEADFFRVLGVQAAVGKLFDRIDSNQCHDCVVVSHSFWRSVLDADPNTIGSTFRIAGREQRVIGVLPKQFWFFLDSPAVWTLIQHGGYGDPDSAQVFAVARLQPNTSMNSVMSDLVDLYWRLPPRIKGNQLEAASVIALNHNPLYMWFPMIACAVFIIAGALVLALPQKATRTRAAAYFVTKFAIAACAVGILVAEFAPIAAIRLWGDYGFGLLTLSMWAFTVGILLSLWWAWRDQHGRCPFCLHRLALPVQMGSRGHVLMDRMSTELVCANGHGLLWAEENSLESHSKNRWLQLDDSWKDLFEVSDKR